MYIISISDDPLYKWGSRLSILPGNRRRTITCAVLVLSSFCWFGPASLMPLWRFRMLISAAGIANLVIASLILPFLVRLLMFGFKERLSIRLITAIILWGGAGSFLLAGFCQSYPGLWWMRLLSGSWGIPFALAQYGGIPWGSHGPEDRGITLFPWRNAGGALALIGVPVLWMGFAAIAFNHFQLIWKISTWTISLTLFLSYFLLSPRLKRKSPNHLFPKTPLKVAYKLPLPGNNLPDGRWEIFYLALACSASMGAELVIGNLSSLLFADHFGTSLPMTGLIAGSFFGLPLFFLHRPGNRAPWWPGLNFRNCLAPLLLLEGISILIFSRSTILATAILCLLSTALLAQVVNSSVFSLARDAGSPPLGKLAFLAGGGAELGAILLVLMLGNLRNGWISVLSGLGLALILSAVCCWILDLLEPKRMTGSKSLENNPLPEAALLYQDNSGK